MSEQAMRPCLDHVVKSGDTEAPFQGIFERQGFYFNAHAIVSLRTCFHMVSLFLIDMF